jgi:hypothetical protein
MYNVRFRLIIVLVAFFLSAGLWGLGVFFTRARLPESALARNAQTRSVQTWGEYAVLVLDDAIPDREIRAGLESGGFSGIISESTQWVFLFFFGSIEQIPLDEYDKRVFPFDPRNDGYAEKLRSLFVHDGQRFVYLPLGFATRAGMEKKIASAMGDIPYSLEITVPASRPLRPPWLLITLFCAAAAALLIIPPLRKTKTLRPKRNEIFKSPSVNRYGHRRFVPVPIISRGSLSAKFAASPVRPKRSHKSSFNFALVLLPFAIIALVLAVLDAAPRSSAPDVPLRRDVPSYQLFTTLTEEDYYNHFLFQSTFSYRSLNSSDDVSLAGLSAYEFADDGLPVKTADGVPLINAAAEIPPFPLRKLLQQIGGR